MNVQDAAFAVQDAFSDDFVYLQPVGEKRFDPATVGFLLGLWVLSAVADGIVEGVRETIKDQAKSVVIAVADAVKRRVGDYLRRPFESGKSTREVLDQRQKETEQRIEDAQGALRQYPTGDPDELASAVAAAIRESLRERRLPEKTGEGVEQVVHKQVLILIAQKADE